jgi:hypothetical protein
VAWRSINIASLINDFASHKGWHYMIHGHVSVAAPLVGAISRIDDRHKACHYKMYDTRPPPNGFLPA